MGVTYMEQPGKLEAIEAGNLVDIGKDVLDMANGVDAFTKACIDVIGRFEIETNEYIEEITQIVHDTWEWGAFLERVKSNPQEIITDDLFNLVNGKDYSSYEHKFYQPSLSAKIYEKRGGFHLPISFTEDRTKTAFTNMSEMARLFAGIRENVRQNIKLVRDGYSHMLVASGIAISDKLITTSRHLQTEAVNLGILTEVVDPQKAMENDKFMLYALRRIATDRDYLRTPNAAFNNKSGAYSSGESALFLLNEFEKAARFGVLASTYHSDKISVGKYDVVNKWQGVLSADGNNAYDFNTVSSIDISDTANELGLQSVSPVNISGCIGFLCDKKALGILCEYQKVTSSYTASADFWTDFHHYLSNYMIDPDYSMIAYLLD